MPPLSIMIKPVSSACNMSCRYCFYADVAAHREIMSYGTMSRETMRALIRRAFMYADGSVSFAFQGGEPTLAGVVFYRDFVQTVGRYNTRNLPVSYALQTNGYALTDEMCVFFAENRFLVGVSVDGTRDIHNAIRPDRERCGSYDQVMRGIDMLRSHGVEYNILCVVTAPIAAQSKACWENLKRHQYLQFIPCIDAFDGQRQAFSLSAEVYGQFLIDAFACYERAYYAGKPVSERRFDNYLSMLLGRRPEACGMNGVCGIYFLAEADGGIYPCDFYVLDDWRLGNINETSFQRMEKSERARAFWTLSCVLPAACRTCSWLRLCRGGCRRDREPFVDGTPQENRFCQSYRMFFQACLPRMKKLARKIALASRSSFDG